MSAFQPDLGPDGSLPAGTVLAHRYRVAAPLGRGAMGLVYEALDEELGRKVAVKILPTERWSDPNAVERFLRQARAMARIEHRATVRVYDRGLHEDRIPFVVMERLFGRDLREALRERGRFSPEDAVRLGIELCDAVFAAHGQGVIHRDLKPSNVFLLDGGGGPGEPEIRLLDFGVARLASEPPLTGSADVLGTYAYMAPEVLGGAQEASVASDVYAIACILYELLAGRSPFRAGSRAELLSAITHDPPRPLAPSVPGLPEGLEALLLQNLAKDPGARQRSALDFAEALRELPAAAQAATARSLQREEPAELGRGRFRLLARLGEGGFGTVYEAFDALLRKRVALKRLRSLRPHDLHRLKREFRTAAALSHPNLVQLHELWVERGEAFLTMELIEGAGLLEHVRRAREQIPGAFAQLAAALAALHARGLVHRDLKPENVLVDAAGRVVLLDFGLTVLEGERTRVAGTPAYMPKELLDGVVLADADLYAFGVMLHEALTLARPGELTAEFVPEARLAAPWALCRELLSDSAPSRPRAAEICARLSACAQGTAAGAAELAKSVADSQSASAPFVGRKREREAFAAALERTRVQGPALFLLAGQSGIGKSALLAELAREQSQRALCLSSRCRESEVVPFPALDAAFDALAEYLTRLPSALAASLLPRDSHALAQLFPVLRRLDALEDRAYAPLPPDPVQVRTLAYAALRRLLRTLSEQRPLVLFADDVQWIDQDSAALLVYLLSGQEPPALLLVCALRSDADPAPGLRVLTDALAARTEWVELGELAAPDCHALVRALLPAETALSEGEVSRIAEQSAGNPLFLSTLVSYADELSAEELSLEAALRRRLSSASVRAARVLELAAVCERPLPLEVILEAAGEEDRAVAHWLRAAHLARRVKVQEREGIEPYHARVREAVLATLGEPLRAAHHRALASALASRADEHPDALIEHLAGAGEGERAAGLAVRSAASAHAQLAFDRAAALYAIALRHGKPQAEDELRWLLGRASSLRNAGRSVDAAAILQEASARAPGREGDRLLREAGELLLFAGRVDDGLALLAPMLERAGIALPGSVSDAIAQGLTAFGELAQRGLAEARRAAPPEARELERLDLCLSLAEGLALIDLRGVPFAVSALGLALDLGEPERLQRASATFVTLTAGLFFNPLIEPVIALCRGLTAQLGAPYARAMLYQAEGEAAHFSARFLIAEAAFEHAERILLESCVGKNRELAAARNGTVLIEYAQKGDFRSQLARTLAWQADAEARKDTFHENVLRLAHSIVWVAQDDPRKARVELERARAHFRDGAGAYELGMLEFWDIVDRYEGDDEAHLHPLQGRRDVLESPVAQNPFLAGYIHLHRAWGAIRALAAGRHFRGERELSAQSIAALRALGPEVWSAVADAYAANLDYLEGERERALSRLEHAELTFRGLHMRCLAACARVRRGELAGGELGARLVHDASAELSQLGIARPDRWTRAYFSPFVAEQASALTLATREPA